MVNMELVGAVKESVTKEPELDWPKLPKIGELVKDNLLDLCYNTYPIPEQEQHNFDHPEDCRCMPTATCYMDDDGLVELLFVDHKWIQ